MEKQIDFLNNSYRYISAKAAKYSNGRISRQMHYFSQAKWESGHIETIYDFNKSIYQDRGLDYNPEKFPYKNGKMVLFETKFPLRKNNNVEYVPVFIVYNPESKFNTFVYQMRTQIKEVDAAYSLMYQIVNLNFAPTKIMKDMQNFKNKIILIEIGDIVWSGEEYIKDENGRNGIQQILAIPFRVNIEEKGDK